ncbi:MAG: hypothetical protein GWN01_01145, partial [Nitrosopumilaceae archaeon]|nr:hypothetical protein [Nitrosopumilaceae archaeon]NIU85972.1 hypothetical protein [Nitrosopumilaceae archaeon]NIV64791.1 hypothetical protein [Nitrosopumilaceae archaeon]NIX60186.1 hypothetical protein [Nitrosopumilaceae archaeon]
GGEGDEKGEDDSKSTTQQQQSPPPSTTEDVPEEEETGNTPDLVPEKEKEEKTAKPIISIQGFPDPSKSPNHYYERYSKEKQYKEWFDSIFVGYTPAEVVGYPQTHIPGFPDPARAPQYYIDRYDNEPEYREWFDSQFPEKTIQEVVIPSDKVQNVMPEWIKITSKQWSSGEIQDQMFVSVIKHLIQNDVIQNKPDFVPNSSSSSSLQDGDEENSIPEWVKNNAGWWA